MQQALQALAFKLAEFRRQGKISGLFKICQSKMDGLCDSRLSCRIVLCEQTALVFGGQPEMLQRGVHQSATQTRIQAIDRRFQRRSGQAVAIEGPGRA